jgi:hypothetical protein
LFFALPAATVDVAFSELKVESYKGNKKKNSPALSNIPTWKVDSILRINKAKIAANTIALRIALARFFRT